MLSFFQTAEYLLGKAARKFGELTIGTKITDAGGKLSIALAVKTAVLFTHTGNKVMF